MDDKYRAPHSAVSAALKIEGSRFIADLFPCRDEEESRKHLHTVKKKYFDASHHCFALVLGNEKKIRRTSDDGEPSGTAGVKIAAAIQAADLSDTLIVVTRYFGGTKLGVGGLGRAYFTAAASAVQSASVIHKALVSELSISFPFSETNSVMTFIHSRSLTVASTAYRDDQTILTLHILSSVLESMRTLLIDATHGRAGITIGKQKTVVWK